MFILMISSVAYYLNKFGIEIVLRAICLLAVVYSNAYLNDNSITSVIAGSC